MNLEKRKFSKIAWVIGFFLGVGIGAFGVFQIFFLWTTIRSGGLW